MKSISIFIAGIILQGCLCNIWDNVYSQLQADSPILVKESFNFDFEVPQYTLVFNVDYNSQLRLLTVSAFSQLGLIKFQVAKGQLDLATLIITQHAINSGRCHRYQHERLSGLEKGKGVGQDRMFLINLLFRFIERRGSVDVYQFEPVLIRPNQKQLTEIQKQAKKRAGERGQDLDFDLDEEPEIDMWVHIDIKTGAIRHIYTGPEGKTSVPFQAVSKIKGPYHCQAELQIITNQDISDSLKQLANGRSPSGPRPPPRY